MTKYTIEEVFHKKLLLQSVELEKLPDLFLTQIIDDEVFKNRIEDNFDEEEINRIRRVYYSSTYEERSFELSIKWEELQRDGD